MLCEEIMTITKTWSALSLQQNIKHATPPKTQSNIRKTNKYCTNCGMINHNVETCRKKEQTIMATIEAVNK
jgi:UV DNA damage repair endonuclease